MSNYNDYGVDLLSTLMSKAGSSGHVSLLYGVQVKSGRELFRYSGPQLVGWLKAINIPLLMCRANRQEGRVKLYTTWCLNHLLLNHEGEDIKKIAFIEDFGDGEYLKMPTVEKQKATVWLGKPIIDVTVTDLARSDHVSELEKIVSEWIKVDAKNYFARMSGLPAVFGYVKWETNRWMHSSRWVWAKGYSFGNKRTTEALDLIAECATVIALSEGVSNPMVADLKTFVSKHIANASAFTKKQLGI